MKRKRKYKIKKKKKQSFLKKIFFSFGVFLFLLVIACSAFYKFSPNFKIKGMEVVGSKTVSQEEIKKVAENLFVSSFNLFGQEIVLDNIFLSLSSKSDELLKQFPEIENINIKKDYSKGLIYLEILEKEPIAVWCDNIKCYLIDKKGSFVRNYNNENNYYTIKEVENDEYDKKNILACSLKVKEKIEKYGLKINEFLVYKEKFVLSKIGNCDIIFNLKDDFDWQVEKMEIVLKQDKYRNNLNNLNYIDLRFGNQAVVK